MNIAIYRLMAGFRRFREKYYLQDNPEVSIYSRLSTSGQTPKTMLIGCSDSRVDPAILTGASPGELFVVRNVANLVPPCEAFSHGFHGTSSSLEFAVKNLKVENIIILGHRQCGGIRALMRPPEHDSFIARWMSIAKEAREIVLAEHPEADEETQWRFAEMESMKVSLRNLMTFPFIQEAVKAGTLTLYGIYFDLEQGQLWMLDDTTHQFQQMEL
jgi:carbonic anhydrase